MTILDWSTVAASNSTAAPGINWAENQTPSSVNDSARAMMADVAAWRDAMDPAGRIEQYGGASAPTGWLECDGSAVSRTTYARLFTAVASTWGAGDGSTTFNVPDFRGRTLVGKGTGSGLTARALAATGGEESHSLTTPELAAHTHTMSTVLKYQTSTGFGPYKDATDANTPGPLEVSQSTGSGTAHQNMQPFAVTMFIIRI